MSITQKLYDCFDPDVQDKDIAAALWFFSDREIEKIFKQAKKDNARACRRFLSARQAADKEFGSGWRVAITDLRRDQKLERDLEKLGLPSGRDEFISYWIVPASRMRAVEILQFGLLNEDETT